MVRTLWQRLFPSTVNAPRRRLQTTRLSLEALEDRLVLSTFLVTNASDNLAPGSLRYAIQQANLPGNANSTVDITSEVEEPIVLTQGELPINASMTIRNDSGCSLEIHQSTANARVFHVGSNAAAVTIVGGGADTLTIDGGRASGGNGGGFLVDSSATTLTLNDVKIVNNSADGDGGGIYAAGSVILNHSIVAGNMSGADGGGLFVNDGDVTLNAGSSVSGNRAPNGKGGGINVALGTVAIGNGSHVDGNTARNVGGIEVANVPQSNDVAVSVGGGSTVNGNSSTATVNPFTGDFGGGGIAVEMFGNVLISASQVNGNHTVGMYSGGIVVGLGSVTVTDGSQIDNNTNNGPGGGIAANFLGTVTVSNGSQVNGNTGAALGGGIINFAGPLGGVVVSGGSQVDGNVLTNAETIGQAIAVFVLYAHAPSTLGQFAATLSGPNGGALLAALPQIQSESDLYAQLAVNLPGPLVAGGGIATLLAPISVSGGSEVNNNFAGQRVSGGNDSSVGIGGGLFSVLGWISVDHSSVSGNQAPFGGGGGIFDWLGLVTLDQAAIDGNSTGANGGGFWIGGGLFANSSTLSGNAASVEGGGLYNAGLALFLGSAIRNNQAMSGGGIANHGKLLPINTLFIGNEPDNVSGF